MNISQILILSRHHKIQEILCKLEAILGIVSSSYYLLLQGIKILAWYIGPNGIETKIVSSTLSLQGIFFKCKKSSLKVPKFWYQSNTTLNTLNWELFKRVVWYQSSSHIRKSSNTQQNQSLQIHTKIEGTISFSCFNWTPLFSGA